MTPSEESWNKTEENFKKFFEQLRKVSKQSVAKSREVMQSRMSLQIQLQNIKENVRKQVQDISQIQEKQRILKENEAKIDANKDFTYTEQISTTEVSSCCLLCLNCRTCQKTCHVGCWSR